VRKTPILNFFKFPSKFETKPHLNVNMKFKCKVCKHECRAPYGELSNLHKHIRLHPDLVSWKIKYNKHTGRSVSTAISNKLLSLIKFFVTSNISFANLTNEHFYAILDPNIHCPSYDVFRNRILPEVYDRLHKAIEIKLKLGMSVGLIVDIWTNRTNKDYIALAAIIMNSQFEKEICVIGMIRMPPGGHNADNIKKTVEELVNKYDFDKSKIHCKCTF
jgi:hypothetical protein